MKAQPRRRLDAIRAHFFGSWPSTLVTLAGAWLVLRLLSALYVWAWRDAGFGTTPEACEGVEGACWAVIGDFWRVFLVGLYPEAERWRAFSAFGILAALLVLLGIRRVRRGRWSGAAAAAALVAMFLLVRGGVFGLEPVPTRNWGGLMITIGLAGVGLGAGIPAGVLLALGRRSREYPVVRLCCAAFIDLVRSVPFVLILIMGTILLPLFLPAGWDVDLLLRAQIAIIMSAAANSAEIVRGGLAGIGSGQEEAATALGLGYWRTMRLVLLPQALRYMVPVFVSMFIIFLKDTSLVVVVGLFDLLGAATLATGNPAWTGRNLEAYLFVGAIYFVMCFAMSRFSRRLERATRQR